MKRAATRPARPLHILLAAFAAIFVVTLSATTAIQQQDATEVIQGHPATPSQVLVKFRAPAPADLVEDTAREVDADHHRPVGGVGVRLFHSRRFSAAEMIARLSKRGDVAWAEPNYIVRVLQVPSDPQFPQLWGLQNVGQAVNGGAAGTAGADIHAVSAWEITSGSRDIVVGVVDTGIDYTHPDLVPNVWSAPAPFEVTLGGVTIACAAGTHGFNAIARTCDPMDDHNHGTHVSGTIGAVGNNGVGVAGVNWTTAIMGAKFIGPDGSGTTADGIDAIEFVIQTKAAFAPTGAANVRVLSNSWGDYSFSQALLDEINRAADNDMLFVAAAGNNGFPNDLLPMYPASYNASNIISVAATDNADRRAYFSNYGAKTVHLGAPGVDILSTTIGDTYSFFSGTSMATPHVSGAAALVLSKCAFDTAGLKADLLANVDQVAGLSGATITGGRLNVEKAIRGCTEAPAVPEGLTATGANAQVSLTWTPASGATTYNVKRSGTAGGPYTTVGSVSAAAYVDSGVTNDVTYYYVVSSVNLVGESANSLEVSATPKIPPDLVVSVLTLPAAAAPGDVIAVTDTTRNQGSGVAVASITRFYVSANSTLDATDTLLDGSRAVPELAPGLSSSGPTSLTIPVGTTPGVRFIVAKADAGNAIAETSDTNNTLARSIAIGPDLVISALQAPSFVAPGAVVTVTDTVKNQTAGLAGAFTVRFYVSANSTLDSGDPLLQGSRAVAALAAGATSTGATQITFPADLDVGRYFLVAKADADNVVAESSETNNTMARAIQAGPDLTVSAFTAPTTGGAGGTIVVSDTVTNQGSVTAAGSTTRFYLSTNSSLDAADTLLDGSRTVPALAAGEVSSGSTSVALPPAVATDTYYLIARTDADNIVAETSETNNTRARSLAIGPDLVVSALTAPSKVASGSIVSLTDTVKNQGGGAAGASVTHFYLSINATFDVGDTLLDGSRTVPELAVAASNSGTTSVTIPPGLAGGTYYVIARADADNGVAETYENNNSSVRSVSIGPDLVVSALQAPSNVAPGSVVVVTDTVKNQGAGAAGPSTTRFYLSVNLTFDAGDTLLDGSRAVPGLAASASSAGTASVTIPEGVGVGTYYMIAKADADNAVVETSETNNTSARTVKAGPDLVVSAMSTLASTPAGGVVAVTVTTRNQGSSAAEMSTTRFYLSANATLDAGDTLLDGSHSVSALDAGASGTGSISLTIPAGLAPGTYYVVAKADADGVVAEATENNNTFARSISVKAGT